MFVASIAAIHLVAVMSPGPDFMLVLKAAMQKPGRTAFATAVGVTAGNLFHVLFAILIAKKFKSLDPTFMKIYAAIAALYLFKLSFQCIKGFMQPGDAPNLNGRSAIGFKGGFIACLLNPKAVMYFMSIVAPFLADNFSLPKIAATIATVTIVAGLWFNYIAYVGSHHLVNKILAKWRRHLDLVLGCMFLALGISLIYTMCF